MTPRICAFETPSVPTLSSAITTTTSATASGEPSRRRATSRAAVTTGTSACRMPLDSSASEPLRITMATSGWPVMPSVRSMPSPSIRTEENTNTTSATPAAVAIVVVLRTARLRTL